MNVFGDVREIWKTTDVCVVLKPIDERPSDMSALRTAAKESGYVFCKHADEDDFEDLSMAEGGIPKLSGPRAEIWCKPGKCPQV